MFLRKKDNYARIFPWIGNSSDWDNFCEWKCHKRLVVSLIIILAMMGHPMKSMSIQNSNQKNHFWTSEFSGPTQSWQNISAQSEIHSSNSQPSNSTRQTHTVKQYCHALFRAMILSWLDYCNGLLGGALKSLLGQLSGVMRAAARLILVLPQQSHMTSEIRARLHWLDMPSLV